MEHFIEIYLKSFLVFLIITPLIGIALGLYLAPYIVAARRGHPNKKPILVINLCLGWTVIAWVLCLAWAVCDLEKVILKEQKSKFDKRKWIFRYAVFLIVVTIPITIWQTIKGY
ncbi:MAG: superinfection immunity protein [Alphaproteobacteria bacterium]|nr:superinfection immunity protein [Chitinophagia bacterium]NDE91637.1 superinfection immunity protein [Alphaproteobacteria bacterium]